MRKEKDTTFVVSFSWRGAMRLERMPPHPEHIGDIMLAFRSIRIWKNICEALRNETAVPSEKSERRFFIGSKSGRLAMIVAR